MKKIIISLAIMTAVISCKGPGSGPLSKESFDKKGETTEATEAQSHGGMVKPEKASVTITPCEGCIKIADLIANKKSYAGKTIKVSGVVTKYNAEIMGKNWVHIQDGSESNGQFDLTITTSQKVVVDENVTFEGIIALDKDFGYGYVYGILMEEGKVVN
jgi:hypothetical protein